ncbi:MAG: helix-turn-helix transcriptional regulator [Xanthobacteraceae bacterium]|jgi:transcriptional regulator with XRE-family HTH domain
MSRHPSAIDAHVGKRLRMRRLVLRISQEILAAKLGVTFQQVQKYENGTNRVSAGRLHSIAHILQVPVQFFFDGLPEIKAGGKGHQHTSHSFTSDFLASSDGIAIAKAFTQIKSRTLRRHIAQMIKVIAATSAVEK